MKAVLYLIQVAMAGSTVEAHFVYGMGRDNEDVP